MKEKYKLFGEIAKVSNSKDWESIKKEWILTDIYKLEKGQTSSCICGHSPIREICVIQNKINNYELELGNCCAKNFDEINSGKIFRSIDNVFKNIFKNLDMYIISKAKEKNILTDKDFIFYTNIYNLRQAKLTQRQLIYKRDLNNKILNWIKNKHQ